IEKARELHFKLLDLTEALFNETNPIPVKAGVNLLGYCENEIRKPLIWASTDTINLVKEKLNKLSII
ncbi:MAG: dihydrodipicolinate synthase family protein, partial [Spirochaetota bacterium]